MKKYALSVVFALVFMGCGGTQAANFDQDPDVVVSEAGVVGASKPYHGRFDDVKVSSVPASKQIPVGFEGADAAFFKFISAEHGYSITKLKTCFKGNVGLVKSVSIFESDVLLAKKAMEGSCMEFDIKVGLKEDVPVSLQVKADIVDADGATLASGDNVTAGLAGFTAMRKKKSYAVSARYGWLATGNTIFVFKPVTAVVSALTAGNIQSAMVLGGSTVKAGQFSFISADADATLKELSFEIAMPEVLPIVSLTVNGVTAPVVFNSSSNKYEVVFAGLEIGIPVGSQGVAVDVYASYNPVTSAGQGGAKTRTWSRFSLTGYKYLVEETEKEAAVSLTTNPMLIVASMPVISKAADCPTPIVSGWAVGTNAEVMRFTVSAYGGPINLSSIGFSPKYSGKLSSATQYVKIYDKADMTVMLGRAVIGDSGIQSAINLASEYSIPPMSTVEFVLVADTSGLNQAGDSFRIDLTDSAIEPSSMMPTGWFWNDDSVPGSYGNGFLLKHLPITGPTFIK